MACRYECLRVRTASCRDLIQSVASEQRRRSCVGVPRQLSKRDLRGDVLGLGHPQLDTETLRQPAGQAEMVGVIVRYHHASNRMATQIVRNDLVPQSPCGLRVQPGVYQGPTGAVAQHPQIDVVERERQRHAQPIHTTSRPPARCRRRALAEGEKPDLGRRGGQQRQGYAGSWDGEVEMAGLRSYFRSPPGTLAS